MKLRPATARDAIFLLRLRNDPLTRANSFSTDPVGRHVHFAWLARALENPELAASGFTRHRTGCTSTEGLRAWPS